MSIGTALREARTSYGYTQQGLGDQSHLSGSMINEVEHGRRRLPKDIKPELAQHLDSGHLYIELAREATGGPMTAPYLNNIDEHRLAGVAKTREEFTEAITALDKTMPIFIKPPAMVGLDEVRQVEDYMLEMIEATTAAHNQLARVAQAYGISLAALWRRHEAELMQKGYLKKEKDR